jgi:hypothetical protein
MPDHCRRRTAIGRSIRQLVRRADLLAHEDDGRIWVIVPGSGRAGGSRWHRASPRCAGV